MLVYQRVPFVGIFWPRKIPEAQTSLAFLEPNASSFPSLLLVFLPLFDMLKPSTTWVHQCIPQYPKYRNLQFAIVWVKVGQSFQESSNNSPWSSPNPPRSLYMFFNFIHASILINTCSFSLNRCQSQPKKHPSLKTIPRRTSALHSSRYFTTSSSPGGEESTAVWTTGKWQVSWGEKNDIWQCFMGNIMIHHRLCVFYCQDLQRKPSADAVGICTPSLVRIKGDCPTWFADSRPNWWYHW